MLRFGVGCVGLGHVECRVWGSGFQVLRTWVVSLNRGTPKYYNPYYGDPQKGTLVFGNPQFGDSGLGLRSAL